MSNKSALVLVCEGSEEMETIIVVDVLRRANINVTLAFVPEDNKHSTKASVLCSRNVRLVADTILDEDLIKQNNFDVVVLPGGAGGAARLSSSSSVGHLLREHSQRNKDNLIAAVCAAPKALKVHNLFKGQSLTSHPSVKEELKDFYNYKEERVVEDGQLISSRGPGTCFEFALAIAKRLVGEAAVANMPQQMVLPP